MPSKALFSSLFARSLVSCTTQIILSCLTSRLKYLFVQSAAGYYTISCQVFGVPMSNLSIEHLQEILFITCYHIVLQLKWISVLLLTNTIIEDDTSFADFCLLI